ncbi:hypothetical protein OOZ35_14120 [Mesoflavibacter profundi]|uniref:50S ribosomal protein L17 n=1 Tax=Mesoflavibacter profundi TaxID=2708110 RepID=A0ABT4S418_9FLAO|nr:hypothetical protein [Mesoflavibacter profundi]MDA0175884.1 hypothetical protein [Mesoflavibacter profundi]MDA0178635.1 hypothetical protein [Mesoflavibacter profundi]
MITKTVRRKLKRHLKNRYTTDVLKLLSDKQMFNKNGQPYSRGFISHVFNGLNENEDVENAIIEVYEKRKLKVSKKKLKINKVFKK